MRIHNPAYYLTVPKDMVANMCDIKQLTYSISISDILFKQTF